MLKSVSFPHMHVTCVSQPRWVTEHSTTQNVPELSAQEPCWQSTTVTHLPQNFAWVAREHAFARLSLCMAALPSHLRCFACQCFVVFLSLGCHHCGCRIICLSILVLDIWIFFSSMAIMSKVMKRILWTFLFIKKNNTSEWNSWAKRNVHFLTLLSTKKTLLWSAAK